MFSARLWNIVLRTAHIVSMGVLLGGHAFNVERPRLFLALGLTVGTGVALTAVEAGPKLLWFHQGRGVITFVKLAMLCGVPLLWDYRLPILLAVTALASIGSHAPASVRYYSVIYGEVIHDRRGPGGSQINDEENG